MADLTPAATLRAAATLIRETASNATPGPWTFTPDLYPDRGAITSSSLLPDVEGWDVLVMDVHSDLEHDNARWSALMSPAVAEPLAVWLDGVAKDIDGHDPDGGCECTKSDSYHRAMDFAAAILGRQS